MTTLQRLNDLLALVSRQNSFQRERLGDVSRMRSIDDIAGLPLTCKQDLLEDQRENPPFGSNLTFPPELYTHLNHTSGTTGDTLRILDTDDDWRWWASCFARVLHATGIGPGDRVALAYSFGPYVQFWASYAGVLEAGATAVPLGGMESLQRVQTIGDYRATALMATPTYAARLAKVAAAEGLHDALAGIERVVCTGEPGASLPAMRDHIEGAFGARCFDHAGASEAGPFAHPCDAGGMHLDEEEFVHELLDPHSEEPAASDELAELIVTPLGRAGFPVIRYRTGDVVEVSPEPCPAGHPGRWLPNGILGRADDMLVVRGMNVFPSAIEQILREGGGVGEFRITVYTDSYAMDEVKVEAELVEPREARDIQARLRQRLGLRVRIVPVRPGVLPTHDHKSHRVVNRRHLAGTGKAP